MNKELIFKIIAVKKYNKDESILDILAIFDNIINKYSRKLNGEDTKQDLYVFLIKLIKNIDDVFYTSRVCQIFIKKSAINIWYIWKMDFMILLAIFLFLSSDNILHSYLPYMIYM